MVCTNKPWRFVLYLLYLILYGEIASINRQLSPLRGHAFPKPVLCSANAGVCRKHSAGRNIIQPKYHPAEASSVSPRSPSVPGPSAPPAGPLPSRSPPWPPKAVPAAGGFLRILKGRKIQPRDSPPTDSPGWNYKRTDRGCRRTGPSSRKPPPAP